MPSRFLTGVWIILAAVPTLISPGRAVDSDQPPSGWSLEVSLIVTGDYTVREAETQYDGQFFFDMRWTGHLSRDDEDFILYPQPTELAAWDAAESVHSPAGARTLLTADFLGRPELDIRYILRQEHGLNIDFAVEGFPFPQNASQNKFDLVLPASSIHGHRIGETVYNAHIKEGSNLVIIPDRRMDSGPVERSFSWTWRRQGWRETQSRPVYASQSHEAAVKIILTPCRSGAAGKSKAEERNDR